jgi:hypothetical protein
MTDLTDFARLVTLDSGLCVVSTLRGDGTIQSSVVNGGVLDHPLTGRPVVGLGQGGSRKLANLRARPQATIVVRSGWEWAAADGRAELAPAIRCPARCRGVRLLLRAVFTAAGAPTTGRPTTG